MTRRAALLVLLLSALAPAILPCAPKVERCWVCDREIHPNVRATLVLSSGKTVHACCPRCALHYREEPGTSVRDVQVSDYASGDALPFERAFLVEGSDETPCLHHPPVLDETRAPMTICFDRCMPSLIAFRAEEEARRFQAEHGGALFAPGSFPERPAAGR